jgi:hypothetical protein
MMIIIIIIIIITVKVNFTLGLATKAQRRNRCTGLPFFNLCPRWEWVVNATPRTLYFRESEVPTV